MSPSLLLALALIAPPDPGNVLRATRGDDDVVLDFSAASPGSFRILRDADKRDLGTTEVDAGVTPPTWTDPGAIPGAAGGLLLYQIDGDMACASCAGYTDPIVSGSVAEPALTETSGLAASRAHRGVLWAHNDSGDTARFFALATTGEALAEVLLEPGASNLDWEDIALGPCPAGTCVYLADVGDNSATRSEVALYRVVEPDVDLGPPVGTLLVSWERFPFTYVDGPHDCEAVLVEPTSGDVYLVSKEGIGAMSSVYALRAPLTPDVPAVAELVADSTLPALFDGPMTAADAHPCAPRVLLRAYFGMYQLELPGGMPFDDIFTMGSTTMVPLAAETQGEAVTYDATGEGYFTVSEGSLEDFHASTCR